MSTQRYLAIISMLVVTSAPAAVKAQAPASGACQVLAGTALDAEVDPGIVEAARVESINAGDGGCAALVAWRDLNSSACARAEETARAAVAAWPSEPLPRLTHAMAQACGLALEANRRLAGRPLSCAELGAPEIAAELGVSALLLEDPMAAGAAEAAIEVLARTCLDEGELRSVASALATRFGTQTPALARLATEPSQLGGAGLSAAVVTELTAAWLGADYPSSRAQIIRSRMRWLLSSIQASGALDPGASTPIIAGRGLLAADARLTEHGGLSVGAALDDVVLLLDTGLIGQPVVAEPARALAVSWAATASIRPAEITRIEALRERLRALHSPALAHLVLRLGAVLALRAPTTDDACSRTMRLLHATSDFAREARELPVDEYAIDVRPVAALGLEASRECVTASTAAAEFSRVLAELDAGRPPWTRSVSFASP